MKIRTMLGLTFLGTALYAHKRRGGEFTVDSLKESLGDLWRGIQNKTSNVKDKVEHIADKAQDKRSDVGAVTSGVKPGGATQDRSKDALGSGNIPGSNRYVPGGSGNGR